MSLGRNEMEPDFSFVGPGISLDQVDPIHQKRLLAFVNFWLSKTVGFLNNFASSCEMKLLELERRIEQTDTVLTLLEAKLSSVPNIDVVVQPKQENVVVSAPPVAEQKAASPDASNANSAVQKEEIPAEPGAPKLTAQNDPRYSKYFKMVNMGIPVAAVKQKMQMEGIDGSILDNPGAEVPASALKREDSGSEFGADSDSSASFSD